MNKKILLVVIALAVVLGGAVFITGKFRNSSQQKVAGTSDSPMVYFYGQGCPHCANVEKFLEENKGVEETVTFQKLEVWGNAKNRDLLAEKAKQCGIDANSIGVPLFWDGSKCLIGDADIIAFFKEKSNIQ